jgi:NIPSNAP protein
MRRMKRRTLLQSAWMSVFLPAAMQRPFLEASSESPNAEEKREGDAVTESTKVYELRIYHAAPGQIENLVARFRDHTDALFLKHGMKSIAYWRALDEPTKSSTFFYVLEHASREAAAANWKAFQDDPEWKSVKAKSEENGKLVESIDSTYLTLTDFPRPPRI